MRIAIIGAGIIGAAVADALAVRGAEVFMYDMRAPGKGASQASAGVLCPYIEATSGSPLLALGARSLSMWDDWVAAVLARSSRSFHYARTGTLEVAFGDAGGSHLQQSAAWLAAEGVAHEWLDRAALKDFEPQASALATSGLYIAGHAHVDVPALVAALMSAARQHGATCETPTEIIHIEQKSDVVHVRVGDPASSRPLEVDHVVIAAGSWSRRVRVAGAPVFPVRPVRGQLLHLAWTDAALPRRSVWGPRCYTVPWPDGTVLVGATVEDVGFDERSTVDGVRGLMDAVSELLPAAARASLRSVRVGLRPATADQLPLLGPLKDHPRITLAAGHYRNGILLAPYTADVVTRMILDKERDPLLALTRPDRTSLSNIPPG
ncbi:MAG: glycine oxidase ThiO [Acidobacteria bacterium]|nr:glycine oxidase ThiO [Acidobacteriota bacterium]